MIDRSKTHTRLEATSNPADTSEQGRTQAYVKHGTDRRPNVAKHFGFSDGWVNRKKQYKTAAKRITAHKAAKHNPHVDRSKAVGLTSSASHALFSGILYISYIYIYIYK